MNYKKIIEDSYKEYRVCGCYPDADEAIFLANNLFKIDTYDVEEDRFLCKKAIEVTKSIINQCTGDYIDGYGDNYRWFLVMMHLPFFADRTEWGSSIRFPWFCSYGPDNISVPGEWVADYLEEGWGRINLSEEEFVKFMQAAVDFYYENCVE